MSTNFADILDKQTDAIEKPKPLPVGSYLCIVSGPAEFAEIGKNQTPAANLKLKPMQAMADVDQTQLNEMGGIGERTIRHTLWLSEDALWRAKEFATMLGINSTGRKLSAVFQEMPNRQIVATIGHRPSDDGTQLYVEIKKLSAA